MEEHSGKDSQDGPLLNVLIFTAASAGSCIVFDLHSRLVGLVGPEIGRRSSQGLPGITHRHTARQVRHAARSSSCPSSPPGAAGVERAGCSVGPGAGPGGAVPPSPRLGPRPSALGCLHHRLRPQDGLRNLSTENDKLGTSAPVTLRRLRCFYRTRQWYILTEVNQATRRI